MTMPDWIRTAQERLLNEPAPVAAVDAVISVLHELGDVVLLALDVLHSDDKIPGPPAHKNPTTPKEHAENLLYTAHRLYTNGPGRQFIDSPDWMKEIRRTKNRAKDAIGRPTDADGDEGNIELSREAARLILALLRTMKATYSGGDLRDRLPQGLLAMEHALGHLNGGRV